MFGMECGLEATVELVEVVGLVWGVRTWYVGREQYWFEL